MRGMVLGAVLAALLPWLSAGAMAQSTRTSAPAGPSCETPALVPPLEHGVFSVTLNPATSWQPRGGEALVEIRGAPEKLQGLTLWACFSWSQTVPAAPAMSAMLRLRPSDVSSKVNLGVFVPDLKTAPGWLRRVWHSSPDYTAAGVVPLAAMRLMGRNGAGDSFDVVLPLGITSSWAGLIASVAAVALALGLLDLLTRGRGTHAALILRLCQARNGAASLSQFQILIWTLTIGASAIYVMSLSGHLIDMTDGTLILLGIAGGAGFVTALQANLQPGAAALPQRVAPQWSDLITAPEQPGAVDVTRVQMLIFTLVTAGFVLLKVLNSYVVPDIPSGYLLLMGVSNGLYLGGRLTAAKPAAASGVPGTPPVASGAAD
jgi:hypothetical protein